MSDARTLKKMKKLLARVEKHIETSRDALEDLEIEFEVLKATVNRLKPKNVAVQPEAEADEEAGDIETVEAEEMTIEHSSSNTTSVPKF
jgi:septal ring factor EnvC (AmiA/AmiB activator)